MLAPIFISRLTCHKMGLGSIFSSHLFWLDRIGYGILFCCIIGLSKKMKKRCNKMEVPWVTQIHNLLCAWLLIWDMIIGCTCFVPYDNYMRYELLKDTWLETWELTCLVLCFWFVFYSKFFVWICESIP